MRMRKVAEVSLKEAQTKKEYIEKWNEYIKTLYILAMCEDLEVSNKIVKHTKAILKLVSQIADNKKW